MNDKNGFHFFLAIQENIFNRRVCLKGLLTAGEVYQTILNPYHLSPKLQSHGHPPKALEEKLVTEETWKTGFVGNFPGTCKWASQIDISSVTHVCAQVMLLTTLSALPPAFAISVLAQIRFFTPQVKHSFSIYTYEKGKSNRICQGNFIDKYKCKQVQRISTITYPLPNRAKRTVLILQY